MVKSSKGKEKNIIVYTPGLQAARRGQGGALLEWSVGENAALRRQVEGWSFLRSAVRNVMDARPRLLASMIKATLVGRRHGDASPHPQESVLHINVGEGARFREGHREAMVATGIGRVERARVQEARAVIACRVPTWSTEEPIGDRRKGLPGEKRHSMDLVDRVVGPYHRVSNLHVDVLQEIAHDCRVVEDHIAACR